MKLILKYSLFILAFSILYACEDDLNIEVEDPDIVVSDVVYEDVDDYLSGVAKLYAGFATTGQTGPAGNADISNVDEGASNYIRQFWMLQEIPTDEAVLGWGDPGIPELNTMEWSSGNVNIAAMYYRIFFTVAAANEFLRESTPEKVSSRGITGADAETIATYRLEARFIRALVYMHGIDLFGDIPLITEEDPVGVYYPTKNDKGEVFDFIESELLAIESEMLSPRAVYGRADQAAAWMTLAKLYINAEVYSGESRYTDALTYLNFVINSGYSLDDNYDHVFYADNHTSSEIVFPIVFDGVETETYGGTTFLAHGAVGGNMNATDYGIDGGWAGMRTTKSLVLLYPYDVEYTDSPDNRANFYTDNQSLEIPQILNDFASGFAIEKYRNITSDGQQAQDLVFADIDFPVYRLADAYLMYAEAVLRGGSGGSLGDAVNYINQLRQRAYGDMSANISQSDLTLDFVLDERARELYWEGHRRTDLIRFGVFTGGSYLWPWKGGTQNGVGVDSFLSIFPIPSAELSANPNMTQNDGY